jgi:transmembrane sensor
MSRFDAIEKQASAWLAREDRGLSESEQAALGVWLAEDTAHQVCYLRLKALWQCVDRLADPELPQPVPIRPAPRAWDAGVAWRAIAAGVLVALLGTGGWYFSGHVLPSGETRTIYVTGLGQSQAVQLADGTKVQLNTSTRLRQELTSTARVVRLEKGEAFFDVAKDPRPFVVYAGNRKITDIGTKFSVRREGDGIEVLIAEGRVRVDMSNGRARPVEAGAGSIVVARADGTLVALKTSQDIANKLSWRQGMLVFDQEELGSAAAEFNRYNNKHIIVVGAARNLRIGGRFRPNNVEVFTSLIKEGFGLKIEDTGTEIIVSE